MVADIEKLIKKKIELEPIEIDDDRPRRPRRRDDDDGERLAAPLSSAATDLVAAPSQAAAQIAVAERPRRPSASRDPFFDKPYEPTGSGAAAWESAAKPGTPPLASRGMSPNIRPKKKVASLLGGTP
jgi:hypothetical protein